jgi:hypothetical protein
MKLLSLVVFSSLAFALLSSSSASAQQVWFAPNDDLARGPNRDRYLNHDFPQLFDPKPAWDAKIDVLMRVRLRKSIVNYPSSISRDTCCQERKVFSES